MRSRRLLLTATMSVVAGGTASGQRAPIAITDVTVIDGMGDAARPHTTVVIGGGKIIAIDSMSRAKIPARAHGRKSQRACVSDPGSGQQAPCSRARRACAG